MATVTLIHQPDRVSFGNTQLAAYQKDRETEEGVQGQSLFVRI